MGVACGEMAVPEEGVTADGGGRRLQANRKTWGLKVGEALGQRWGARVDSRGMGWWKGARSLWLLGLSRAGFCVSALAPQTWALGSGDGSETRRPSSVCAED